jgi:hypothetical protein
MHGAELQERKGDSIPAYPLLTKEDGARGGEFNSDRDNKKDWTKKDERHGTAQNIDGPLR